MNTDGIRLLERVRDTKDPELVKLIERCANYARTRKDIELIEFRKVVSGTKVYADDVMVHLLNRLLNNLT